jgi:hypothetical protein
VPIDPLQKLKFTNWRRSSIYDLVPNEVLTDGRMVGELPLTLRDTYSPDLATEKIPFHIVAPRDIAGIVPQAIIRTAPAALAHDVEMTKFVHVDFADPDFPWRYTPRKANGENLAPWIAILVGSATELELAGSMVKILQPTVFAGYDLTQAHLFAHVQDDGHRLMSRLISPCPLRAQTAYIAVIVPAFDDAGQFAWDVGGGRIPAALPIFHTWRFWTADEGDFETLAWKIMPVEVPGLGRAPLAYRHGPVAVDLEIRGAITSLGGDPDGADEAVARADLQDFKGAVDALSAEDPLGRAVIGLPSYGRPWIDGLSGTTWAASLNSDPRYRGTAGLGLWMGIEGQQELVDAAISQLGAVRLAGHLVANLAFGLLAAQSLWNRRLPTEPSRQVHLFSPLMRRMRAKNGNALDAITGPNSPLGSALFSSAARRLLRRGAAWTRHTQNSFVGRGEMVDLANQCPPAPEKSLLGLPHIDDLGRALGLPPLEDHAVLDLQPIGPHVRATIDRLIGIKISFVDARFMRALQDLTDAIGRDHGPCERHIPYLNQHRGEIATRSLLTTAARQCTLANGWTPFHDVPPVDGRQIDIRDLRDFVGSLVRDPAPSPCAPPDLGHVADVVGKAINPNGPNSPAVRRVQSRIKGLDIGTLTPPELPIGMDFPTWTLLRDHSKEWIIPGVERLPKDSVVAMQTNPTFIDAYLAGLNKQLLDELHWRNVPVDRRSTPLLMFWGHMNFETGQREAEIRPFTEWGALTDLGALDHQVRHPGDASGKQDLVIVFRSDLFWRYPATLVYLVKRRPIPDPDTDLKATPIFEFTPATRDDRIFLGPIFQGALARDLVFFAFDVDPQDLDQYSVMLDEPPSELRFRPRNAAGNPLGMGALHGAAFAKATIDRKTRVAIDGPYLEALGLRL